MTSPTPDLIDELQELVSQVPDVLQPLVVAAAGAIPFVEGEGAASLGVVAGINPVVAGVAAAVGNFLCVALLVLLGSGVRTAIVTRSADRSTDRRASVTAQGGATATSVLTAPPQTGSRSKRMGKFQRAFERYGVPGVSLLGPLVLPTMFTATALVASGVSKSRVLAWQALAIVLWTGAFTAIAAGVLTTVR